MKCFGLVLSVCVLVSISSFGDTEAKDLKTSGSVRVAYLGREGADNFNNKIKPIFEESAQCKNCQLIDMTPYGESQKYDESQLSRRLGEIDESFQIVFFDWNDRTSSRDAAVLESLKKFRSRRQVVVAAAGAPAPSESSGPLDMTLFGKVEGIVLIGELVDRDILFPKNCYYGPQMLTAVRPPKEHKGKGVAPLIFVAKFASHYKRRNSEEWIQYFRQKKSKNRKIWPDLEDFFPR